MASVVREMKSNELTKFEFGPVAEPAPSVELSDGVRAKPRPHSDRAWVEFDNFEWQPVGYLTASPDVLS